MLLPWEIDNMFEEKSATIVNMAMIVAYLGFYYFQMHFAWGMV